MAKHKDTLPGAKGNRETDDYLAALAGGDRKNLRVYWMTRGYIRARLALMGHCMLTDDTSSPPNAECRAWFDQGRAEAIEMHRVGADPDAPIQKRTSRAKATSALRAASGNVVPLFNSGR